LISKHDYLRMVQGEFNAVLDGYACMLRELSGTKDREAAEELVDVVTKCKINPLLSDLAQDICIAREKGLHEVLKRNRSGFAHGTM